MTMSELQIMLNTAQNDFGINSSYSIPEEGKTAIEGIQASIINGSLDVDKARVKIGNVFSANLFGSIQQYMIEKRRIFVPNDKIYSDSVDCQEAYGVSVASFEQLLIQRGREYGKLLPGFPIDNIKVELGRPENESVRFGFVRAKKIYDQAGVLQALRAMLLSSALKEYPTADCGFQKTLILSYSEILDRLESRGMERETLSDVLPYNFQTRIERIRPLVVDDEQVRKYTDELQSIARLIISSKDLIMSDVVEDARKTIEILGGKSLTKTLNPEEREFAREFLHRSNAEAKRLKERSTAEYIHEPEEKI